MENEIERKYSGVKTDDEGYLAQYADQYIAGMRTGVFTYGAHPDLVDFVGDAAVFEKHYGRLLEAAKELRVPMEINFLGIRDHRAYPHERFFRLCGEIGAEVCFGCDAHSADVAVDAASYRAAMEMVEKFGLVLNESPELRPVKASV
jgi:histidinol-phosphatase (PHP family)